MDLPRMRPRDFCSPYWRDIRSGPCLSCRKRPGYVQMAALCTVCWCLAVNSGAAELLDPDQGPPA